MKVHLYASCWNEEKMLPFFFRHYRPVVDRFFIYDDGSSDRSRGLIHSQRRAEVFAFASRGRSYVESLLELYNRCWKASRGRADWVVVCNVDEHLYHPHGLRPYLEACRRRGVTVIPSLGYEMCSDAFPRGPGPLCVKVRAGAPLGLWNKVCIFDPNRIDEIHFEVGRHYAVPTGRVVFPEESTVRLLHYKYLGLDYVRRRYAALGARRRAGDVSSGFGFQYAWDEATLSDHFKRVKASSVEVVPAPQPWAKAA